MAILKLFGTREKNKGLHIYGNLNASYAEKRSSQGQALFYTDPLPVADVSA